MPPGKKRKEYPIETEAAWYAIREFVNPLFCSYEMDKSVIPFNDKAVLRHHFSNTKVFTPYRYSKGKYHLHLYQLENHYFRSNHNSMHSTGYHRSDKIAQGSVLFDVFGVDTKRKYYGEYYVILIKIDVDGHNHESDPDKVEDWLKTSYFDQSYWEPSTHYSGKHGYVKIAIPLGTPLNHVHEVLNKLFKHLDAKRDLFGYQAPIDSPCGLPPIVSWDNTFPSPGNLPNVSYREFRDFRCLRYEIKNLKREKNFQQLENLDFQISKKFHYNDIVELLKTPVPASIKSTQCGKLPRFNRSGMYEPSIDNIKCFYNLTYYPFSYFEELLHTLGNDPDILSYVPSRNSHSSDYISVDNISSSFDDTAPVLSKCPDDYSDQDKLVILYSFPSSFSFETDITLGRSSPSLLAHSISFPWQEKNVVALSQEEGPHLDINIPTDNYPCNHCLGQIGLEPKNKDSEEEKGSDITKKQYISPDANKRTIEYITTYLREYYREHHTEPTVDLIQDDICEGYRNQCGTGEEDVYDRKRIVSLLKKCIHSFNPCKVGNVKYTKGMFISQIKEVFHREEYKSILENTSAKKCRPNHIKLDLYAGYAYTHLSKNKELTLSSYDGFQKFCHKYRVKMDSNTCLACRLLFEHYEWIEKLKANYTTPTYNGLQKIPGKSMAYTLTPNFPNCDDFEQAVGKKNINKVRIEGLATVQDWDNMGDTA